MKRKVLLITMAVFMLTVWACSSHNIEDDVLPTPTDTTATGHLCDSVPAVVSFGDTILPIVRRYCSDPAINSGCHTVGGQTPFLVDYSSIKIQADQGRIRARVLNGGGNPMPPAGEPTLTECERILLDRWLLAGAPNN
jgi:hypothetical protein